MEDTVAKIVDLRNAFRAGTLDLHMILPAADVVQDEPDENFVPPENNGHFGHDLSVLETQLQASFWM